MSARSLFGGGTPEFRFDTEAAADSDGYAYAYDDASRKMVLTASPRVGAGGTGLLTFVEAGGSGAFPDPQYLSSVILMDDGSRHITLTCAPTGTSVNMSGGTTAIEAAIPEGFAVASGSTVAGTAAYTQGGVRVIGFVAIDEDKICIHPIAGTFSEGALTLSGFSVTYSVPA